MREVGDRVGLWDAMLCDLFPAMSEFMENTGESKYGPESPAHAMLCDLFERFEDYFKPSDGNYRNYEIKEDDGRYAVNCHDDLAAIDSFTFYAIYVAEIEGLDEPLKTLACQAVRLLVDVGFIGIKENLEYLYEWWEQGLEEFDDDAEEAAIHYGDIPSLKADLEGEYKSIMDIVTARKAPSLRRFKSRAAKVADQGWREWLLLVAELAESDYDLFSFESHGHDEEERQILATLFPILLHQDDFCPLSTQCNNMLTADMEAGMLGPCVSWRLGEDGGGKKMVEESLKFNDFVTKAVQVAVDFYALAHPEEQTAT